MTLDPGNKVLAIRRFPHLPLRARAQLQRGHERLSRQLLQFTIISAVLCHHVQQQERLGLHDMVENELLRCWKLVGHGLVGLLVQIILVNARELEHALKRWSRILFNSLFWIDVDLVERNVVFEASRLYLFGRIGSLILPELDAQRLVSVSLFTLHGLNRSLEGAPFLLRHLVEPREQILVLLVVLLLIEDAADLTVNDAEGLMQIYLGTAQLTNSHVEFVFVARRLIDLPVEALHFSLLDVKENFG